MPKKQLITTDFDEIPGTSLIIHIDKPADPVTLEERIQQSYDFRMKEIRKGHIEEAEMMDIQQMKDGYYVHQEDRENELCPMGVDDKTNVKKSVYVFRPSKKPSFDNDKKEPSETPTSHPILKGRLK